MMRCIHLDTVNTLQALYEEMLVKFIGKVSSMGKERYVLILPRAHNKAGKVLKGKHVRVDEEEDLKFQLMRRRI
jgi:hypothetical protein